MVLNGRTLTRTSAQAMLLVRVCGYLRGSRSALD